MRGMIPTEALAGLAIGDDAWSVHRLRKEGDDG